MIRFLNQIDDRPPATEAPATEVVPVTEATTLPAATLVIPPTVTIKLPYIPILAQDHQNLTFGSG
jgi:hypothetical protein